MHAAAKRPRLIDDERLKTAMTLAMQSCGRRRMEALISAAAANPAALQDNATQFNRWFETARRKFVAQLGTQLQNGRVHDMAVLNIRQMLQELLDNSLQVREAFEAALGGPVVQVSWKLIVAFDEYSPGSELTGRHTRKVMNCMISFMELGADNLRREVFWLSGLMLRSDIKRKIEGKWSRALRDFLLHLCWSDVGLSTAGVALRLNGRSFLLKARLHAILADGEGLAEALQWKGGSGIKACWRHWNVLQLGSGLAEHTVNDFVEISCCDGARFREASHAEQTRAFNMVLEARRQHEAGAVAAAVLEDVEKVVGFSITEHGLLACARLSESVLMAARYDWMHCALSGGTLTTELNLLVSVHPDLSWRRLQDFFDLAWQFPRMHASTGAALYSACRASAVSGKARASCSELLTMYALVRHFVFACLHTADESVKEALASFKACCAVVDAFLFVKRRQPTGRYVDIITPKIDAHMALFKAAYGDVYQPKHHWLYDCALQIQRDGGVVLDMFLVERSHRKLKGPSEKRSLKEDDTASSLLAARCATHLCSASVADGLGDGLIRGAAQLPGSEIFASTSLRRHGAMLHVGDVVFNRQLQEVGVIIACLEISATLWVEVQECTFKKRLADHSTAWAKRACCSTVIWNLDSLQLASAWFEDDGNGCMVVVV